MYEVLSFTLPQRYEGSSMPWLNSRVEVPDVQPDLDPESNLEKPYPDPDPSKNNTGSVHVKYTLNFVNMLL